MATLDFDRLCVGELSVSGKGAKSLPLLYGKESVIWQPKSSMLVAYEPGVFSGEDVARVNLCLGPTDDVQEQLVELDEWVIKTVAADSERILGKRQTEDQVRARYHPTLRVSDRGYPPTLRVKMNVVGKGQVRIWQDQRARDAPETWSGREVNVRLLVKTIYLMGVNFGVTIDVTDDSVCQEALTECPFP